MLNWRTLDERVGAIRNVYNRLSFDIKHLLGSSSEFGDVANVPLQHPGNLIHILPVVREGVDRSSNRPGGYHTERRMATIRGQGRAEFRKLQQTTGGTKSVWRRRRRKAVTSQNRLATAFRLLIPGEAKPSSLCGAARQACRLSTRPARRSRRLLLSRAGAMRNRRWPARLRA